MTIYSVVTGWMQSMVSGQPAKLDGTRGDIEHNIRFGDSGSYAGKSVTANTALSLSTAWSAVRLTIIWDGSRSPFDGWAVTLLTGGALVFLAGRTWRDRRHQKANEEQVALYRRERASRRVNK